jgi:hypothetical protein
MKQRKKKVFSTPVLLMAFNRPDHVRDQIRLFRKLNIKKIYIAVDGPRSGNVDDQKAGKEIERILKRITWCKPKKLLRKQNLGCKRAVSSAIDWFFKHVDQGIILEDDCKATPSFFYFCEELLNRYRNEKKVMHISGANFISADSLKESYYFSRYPQCWGWATWRRAWKSYDVDLRQLEDKSSRKMLEQMFPVQKARQYWFNLFSKTQRGLIDTWDYQWIFACWKKKGLAVIPKVNLVTNQGFDARATHTKLSISPLAHRATHTLSFPLIHPRIIKINQELNKKEEKFYDQSLIVKLIKGVMQSISRF